MKLPRRKWMFALLFLAALFVFGAWRLSKRTQVVFIPAITCTDAESERFAIEVLDRHLKTAQNQSIGATWQDGQESMIVEYSPHNRELCYGLNTRYVKNPEPEKWIHIWRNVSVEAIKQVAKTKGTLKDLKQFGATEEKDGLWPKPPRRDCL